jgi:large subunit ribosomal protein L7/L12
MREDQVDDIKNRDSTSGGITRARVRTVGLLLAIRGFFGPSAEDPAAEALEMLALSCVTSLDELLVGDAKEQVTVKLVDFGDRKIDVIKIVREVTGLGLKEAKDVVEAAPSNILKGVAVGEANRARIALESAGGKVALV